MPGNISHTAAGNKNNKGGKIPRKCCSIVSNCWRQDNDTGAALLNDIVVSTTGHFVA